MSAACSSRGPTTAGSKSDSEWSCMCKHDVRLRIEGAHDRNEAGHAVDVNELALPRADVQRHAAGIVRVVERAQPERTFRLEHALVENFEQVDGRIPPFGHAPMSHSLMALDFALASGRTSSR